MMNAALNRFKQVRTPFGGSATAFAVNEGAV